MRVSNLLIMGALSALVFTGCTNNDDNSEWLDSNSVTFNSRIDGLQTKASKDVWSNGDEVGIFMTTQTAEFANKKYVASDGGTLTAAPGQTLRYPEEGTASFIAYYPYSASLNGKTLAVSVDNQADPAKVDLLYSDNAKAIAAGEAVDLAFKHKLSQIVIAVGSDETLPDISGLKISLSGMNTQADFNLADGTLAAKESKANIEMNVNADGTTAEAIILPTTTLDGVKMTFVLDGKTFEWPVSVNGGAGFEAGYKYMYLYPASKPAPPFTETGHSKVLPSSTNVILTPSSVVVGRIIASAVVPSALTFISILALLSLAASVPSARLKSACVFIPEREIFNPLISGRVSSLPTAITI